MATLATLKYLGDLQTECTHVSSGAKLITDAPVSFLGKGESFSGTDLFALSLGTCAMTVMGIYAKKNNLDISGATAEVSRTMADNPRRIQALEVIFHMPGRAFSEKEKKDLMEVAQACPVSMSLGGVEQSIIFDWPE